MLAYLGADKEVFAPEDVAILVGAFDEACQSSLVQLDGNEVLAREILAKRIVETAKLGVLNQQRLTKDALDHLAMTHLSVSRDQPPSSSEG